MEISRALRGGPRDFMPTKDGRVTCVCLDLEIDPAWPNQLLISTPKYLTNARRFAAVKDFVPFFVKRGRFSV
jgi:hypothetical protein